MFNRELFNPYARVTVLETKAEWPSRELNRCKVRLEREDRIGPGSTIEYDWVPKSQVDLALRLAEERVHLTPRTIALMEALWEQAYEDGCTNEALDHADESL